MIFSTLDSQVESVVTMVLCFYVKVMKYYYSGYMNGDVDI
jgi:hypothetical protein